MKIHANKKRKVARLVSAVVGAGLGLGLGAHALRADDAPAPKQRPDQVPVPPLKSWNVPEAKKTGLKNGVTLYLLEDHDLPLVEIQCTLRAGSIWDPADKVGLAAIAGEVWRTGGTKTHPKEELDQLLEKHGATLETGVGHDSGSIHLSVLKEDVDLGLQLMKELLTEPTFDEAKLEQAKRERLAGIKRRDDTAPPIAERVFKMTIFGKTSPQAREIDKKSVAGITRDDLVAWHKQFVVPNNLIVGAFGDIASDELYKKCEDALGGLAGGAPKPEMPLVDVVRKPSWTLVSKEVDQSAIVIGQAGGVRSPKAMDEYAQLVCMNEILGGGGFTSRLMLVVRTDMGLAYDVHSVLGIDYDHPGTFQLVCQTKSQSTVKAIKAMLDQVEKLRNEPPSDEELAVAKESILNEVPFWVDTTDKVVDRALTYEYRSFPQDTLKLFTDALAKVTKEQVQQAAKSYIHPEAFTAVVCGNPADFDAKLETVANGVPIDVIKDPESWAHPGSGEGAAKTDGGAKTGGETAATGDPKAGAELLAKVVEAAGGKKAIDELSCVRMKEKVSIDSEQGARTLKVTATIQFPDKARLEIGTPMGNVVQILDGKKAWVVIPGQGVQKLGAPEVAMFKEQIEESHVGFLKAIAAGAYSATLEGDEDFYGKPAKKLVLRKGEQALTVYVDGGSGALLGKLEEKQGEKLKVSFDDVKPVGGVQVPMKTAARHEGDAKDAKPVQKVVISDAEANPKLDADAFAAPKAEGGDEGGEQPKNEKQKKGEKDDDD